MSAATTPVRVEVTMPVLAEGMEEGTVVSWLKSDGTAVAAGEAIAEIETDKAIAELEAPASGTLSRRVAAGVTVAVGTAIAVIGDSHEPGSPAAADPSPPGERAAPDERGQGAVKASPLARRVAAQLGIDLADVRGSGRGGRIVRADVEAAAPAPRAAGESPPATEIAPTGPEPPAPPTSARGETETVELTRLQRIVAGRMAEAKATVPEFVLSAEVDMEGCVALRAALKRSSPEERVASINDMAIKACGLALREQPRANSSYRDGRLELHGRVNVGFAVAGEGRLVVPTVFDADAKSLGTIARESRRLAERARGGAITAPELAGGTFTVSNLGMFGVDAFTAVVNPPQAAILAVGAIERRPVATEDGLAVRHTARLSLTCDHRVLYGADGARFLARVKALLEQPAAAFTR